MRLTGCPAGLGKRKRALGYEPKFSRRELVLKTRHIGRFQEPGPKVPVNLNRRANNFVSYAIERRFDEHRTNSVQL